MEKIFIAVVAVAAVAFGQTAAAEDMMGHGHMMTSQSRPIMSSMHDHMQTMQSQMNRIHATQDRRERAQLMKEHMQTMQETLQMMDGMGQQQMQSGSPGMTDAHRPGMVQRCDDDSAECRQLNQMADWQQRMQERMGMMQMMMEQMLEHHAVAEQEAMR